jgi:hypothetical protein
MAIQGSHSYLCEIFNKRTRQLPICEAAVALFLHPYFRVAFSSDESVFQVLLRKLVELLAKLRVTISEFQEVLDLLVAYRNYEPPFNSYSYGGKDFDVRAWWWSHVAGPLPIRENHFSNSIQELSARTLSKTADM